MTQEQLRDIFDYKDGQLIWKESRQSAKYGRIVGKPNAAGYIRIYINSKRIMAHRLIWMFHNGDIPVGLDIDHINGLRNDNRIENLRVATRCQNQCNRPKFKNNKSGYKGVYLDKSRNKWRARITVNKKVNHLGLFDTPEEARIEYNKASIQYHKEFSKSC